MEAIALACMYAALLSADSCFGATSCMHNEMYTAACQCRSGCSNPGLQTNGNNDETSKSSLRCSKLSTMARFPGLHSQEDMLRCMRHVPMYVTCTQNGHMGSDKEIEDMGKQPPKRAPKSSGASLMQNFVG